MNKELRKRLEEAAKKYIKIITSDDIPYYHKDVEQGFKAGAEHGYKEAISQAKEWMTKYFPDELDGKGFEFVSRDEILVDFDADMNKLWEGEK